MFCTVNSNITKEFFRKKVALPKGEATFFELGIFSEVFCYTKSEVMLMHSEVFICNKSEVKFAPYITCEANFTAMQLHYEVTSLAVRQT